jgi:hypothetical protein
LVETQWDANTQQTRLHVDRYKSADGDTWFQRRETGTSQLFAPDLPLYQAGAALGEETRAVWTDIHALPIMEGCGISAAVPLGLFEKPVGVVNVSVGLSRISPFLNTLEAGRSGSVYVVDRDGALVTAKTDTTADTDAGIIRIKLALSCIALDNINLKTLDKVIQLEVEDLHEAKLFVGLSPVSRGEGSATKWIVITVIPTADFVATIEQNNRQLAMLLALFVATIALAAVAASGYAIDRPLRRIVTQLRHIEAFRLDRVISTPFSCNRTGVLVRRPGANDTRLVRLRSLLAARTRTSAGRPQTRGPTASTRSHHFVPRPSGVHAYRGAAFSGDARSTP